MNIRERYSRWSRKRTGGKLHAAMLAELHERGVWAVKREPVDRGVFGFLDGVEVSRLASRESDRILGA